MFVAFFDGGCHLALRVGERALEVADALSEGFSELGQLLGSENEQGQAKNYRYLTGTYVKHNHCLNASL